MGGNIKPMPPSKSPIINTYLKLKLCQSNDGLVSMETLCYQATQPHKDTENTDKNILSLTLTLTFFIRAADGGDWALQSKQKVLASCKIIFNI